MRISDWSSDVCSSDLFDGLPRQGGDDITGALGIAAGHILHEPADAHDMRVRLASGEGLHRAHDSGRAAHVPLHVLHARGRLDGNTAGVEGHALADKDSRLLLRAASAVPARSEEHTSELQSLMRISYAVFCLKK